MKLMKLSVMCQYIQQQQQLMPHISETVQLSVELCANYNSPASWPALVG